MRDVAIALAQMGHSPIAYSNVLGEVADDLRRSNIPVVDDLTQLQRAPDIIHGHHHMEVFTALKQFPSAPAVLFCHGEEPWEEMALLHPRILRYCAIDESTCSRLIREGVSPENIEVIFNFCDTQRFTKRAKALPSSPKRALIFSNTATSTNFAAIVKDACKRHSISVDIVGLLNHNAVEDPAALLRNYDLVFCRSRAAIEALCSGCAVILCDSKGLGEMVNTNNLQRLRARNFADWCLTDEISINGVSRELRRYNATDASNVSELMRADADVRQAAATLVKLYASVIREMESHTVDYSKESISEARYMRTLSLLTKANIFHLMDAVNKARGEK